MNDNSNENNRKHIEKIAKEFLSLKEPSKELLNQLVEKITISEENEVTIYFKFKELTNISREEQNKMTECKTVNKRNKKVS